MKCELRIMKRRFIPLLMTLAAACGILVGYYYGSPSAGMNQAFIMQGSNKLNYLLQLVDNHYVDTVDMAKLVEDAMPEILSQLDPHSRYISASEIEGENEQLRGTFGGIGIQFTMQKDTVNVMSLIPTGPAEKVGIMPGDRIVRADTTSLVGLKDTEVMKQLKGEKLSIVELGIIRRGHKGELTFKVQRDDIPVVSIDASYLMPGGIGYVRVKNFGEHTYGELMVALARLKVEGMKSLMLDLRGNSGGYMHIAIQMANEFLPRNQLIVYTEGRKSKREDFRSDGYGTFQHLPLVILVDEGSASASEILSGAIQDNDRGTIVGRRTFGKGLVQQPINFRDGSAIRLTVARYYTPSGRCIQKPYENGHDADYENDLLARYQRGEFFSQDSIHQTGPTYQTRLGRIVYGGGGIMPDVFIPEDTTHVTSYYKEALVSGLLREFAFTYTDENRQRLATFATTASLANFLRAENLAEQFARFGENHDLKRRNLLVQKSRQLIERYLIGSIIYNARSMQEYVEFLNREDKTVLRAQEILRDSGK